MAKIVDDVFDSLDSDIDKIRIRHRQYISYSNEKGAKSVVNEIIDNLLDECKNPRSPGNKGDIEFDERTGFITVSDNGRGIPTSILEKVYTTLNMGSNIDTKKKANLKSDILGQNGTGTLAICGLAERVEITSYRGGTENIWKTIVFEEGKKVSESTGKCPPDKHGMTIKYKPSKVMGNNTRIVWPDVKYDLLNLQYLNKKKINIVSRYIDKDGHVETTKYKMEPFEEILSRNDKSKYTSSVISLVVDNDSVTEELDGENVKRFISMDVAFVYTSSATPYIDSFSNSNNTVDNGDHLDGAIEAICRVLQNATKNSLSEREKENLDIRWDDVKCGLSIAVALRTNYERLYTGQTKHKVVNADIKKITTSMVADALVKYFEKNPPKLKELTAIVKMNAKVRREGEKMRTSVVKTVLTNWKSYSMKNYEPCTLKGIRDYKELFIIEGDSAKGSLKPARDPLFQALFAIRGVSANVFKMSLDQIVGPNGNKEFTDLVTVMGCNIGPKFDLSKLQFSKIIIASDADIDGLFIRSLLMAFFFRVFPEIILDGRLYIAEPPLYRIDDKNDPFVINTADYINRYVKLALKAYKVGVKHGNDIEWFNKETLTRFLSATSNYVDNFTMLSKHYRVNDRLIEIVFEEFANGRYDSVNEFFNTTIKHVPDNVQRLIDRINEEFPEIHFDDSARLIKGSVDGKYQLLEISDSLINNKDIITLISEWGPTRKNPLILRNVKTGMDTSLSLLGILKVLKKYQPTILHRFKGLGENDVDDIRTTIMDPNTRRLIKVTMGDIENDMKIFQLLRGQSPADLAARRDMMHSYTIDPALIDT